MGERGTSAGNLSAGLIGMFAAEMNNRNQNPFKRRIEKAVRSLVSGAAKEPHFDRDRHETTFPTAT